MEGTQHWHIIIVEMMIMMLQIFNINNNIKGKIPSLLIFIQG